MDNQIILITTLTGMVLIFCMSAYSHELYNKIPCFFTSILFPTNESPWEHTKLFYIPPTIWYVIEYFFVGHEYKNFFVAHVLVLVLMPFLMLGIYYLYLGLGFKNNAAFNIILTLFTVIIGSLLAYKISISPNNYSKLSVVLIFVLIFQIISYAILTYIHPPIHLFYDKYNKCYGIAKHSH